MLSKADLSQIKTIVKDVVHVEVEPLKKDIKSMQSDIGSMQSDIGSMKKDIKILKENDVKIRKDLKTASDYFDRGDIVLQKKVERIEKHLGLANN